QVGRLIDDLLEVVEAPTLDDPGRERIDRPERGDEQQGERSEVDGDEPGERRRQENRGSQPWNAPEDRPTGDGPAPLGTGPSNGEVSAHPVAPSEGIVSFTGAPAALRSVVMIGHAAPTTTSPLLKAVSSSPTAAQNVLTSGRCFFSRAIAASNWDCVSSEGSVIFRLGFVLLRYSGASA